VDKIVAAKQSYKIPASLNADYLNDMEITLRNNDGIGLKPLPIKVILFYIFGLFIGAFLIFKIEFINNGFWWQKILFLIFWLALIFVLGKWDDTHRLRVQVIPTLVDYIPKKNREIFTRRNMNATPFFQIVGIKALNDNGLVEYMDGTYAFWYRVVGSASILLFDEDRDAILNRVDSFYRKIGADCEIGFVTSKEPQKVYRQVANLNRRYQALSIKDPDLDKLVDEQYDVLTNYVGAEFKSIHQYCYIKGDNKEALKVLKNVLQSEVENSSLMFKQCIALYGEDLIEVLGNIYQNK
jgi:hypothetical protein